MIPLNSTLVELSEISTSSPSGVHFPLVTDSNSVGMDMWNGISVLKPSTFLPSTSRPLTIAPSFPSETLYDMVEVTSETFSRSAPGGSSSLKAV